MSEYKEMENNLMVMIAEKFQFEYPLPMLTKMLDNRMLEYEWATFMLKKRAITTKES